MKILNIILIFNDIFVNYILTKCYLYIMFDRIDLRTAVLAYWWLVSCVLYSCRSSILEFIYVPFEK